MGKMKEVVTQKQEMDRLSKTLSNDTPTGLEVALLTVLFHELIISECSMRDIDDASVSVDCSDGLIKVHVYSGGSAVHASLDVRFLRAYGTINTLRMALGNHVRDLVDGLEQKVTEHNIVERRRLESGSKRAR